MTAIAAITAIVAIIAIEATTVEIDLIMGLIATALTTIIARIPEIHASFARNHIVVPRSIHRRNKTLKRLDLRLKTSVDSPTRPVDPVTSRNVLLVPIYSI